MIEEVVSRIEDWRGRDVVITPLPGGLTNTNYKVEVDGVPHFVRVPGASTELLAIDRDNEHPKAQSRFPCRCCAQGIASCPRI